MNQEELFLKLDMINEMDRVKIKIQESKDYDALLKLYHALCEFTESEPNEYFIMQDKNEFRKLKETDLKENRKWYHDLIESIKEDIARMMELVR